MNQDKDKAKALAISKIKKLLALSQSANPNEALLAAKRARSLLDKHSLTKEDIECAEASAFLETSAEHEYKRRYLWVIELQAAVAKLNDCIGILCPNDGMILHKFQGFTADAIVAKMTLDYLIDACERSCKAAGVSGRSEKNQFRLGFAAAIIVKVEAILAEREKSIVSSTGTALIPLKIEQITQHFGDLPSFVRPPERKPTPAEAAAFIHGSIAGDRTSLDKQLNECAAV